MPPLPRFGHSMNFYKPSRLLVIYGGKDDTRSVWGHAAFYSDLKIFDLINLFWLTVSIDLGENNKRVARFLHGSVCSGTKLVIFGGM